MPNGKIKRIKDILNKHPNKNETQKKTYLRHFADFWPGGSVRVCFCICLVKRDGHEEVDDLRMVRIQRSESQGHSLVPQTGVIDFVLGVACCAERRVINIEFRKVHVAYV